MSEFEEFTHAVSSAAPPNKPSISFSELKRVAVLGGGADARLIAVLCLSEGADVTLFSAYGAELDALRTSSGITIRGEGPVGTYHVDRDDGASVRITSELDRAVGDADVIFLTGPIHKQRTYTMVLADHLKDGQVLVLAPGRSLGAIEAISNLRIGGCKADVTFVEAQNLPFWIKEQGATLNLTAVGPTPASTLPGGRPHVLEAVKKFLPNLDARENVLASGFEDGSALVELPALLMGGPGAPKAGADIPMGGQPLDENNNFASLLGRQHRILIAKLAEERRAVGRVFGVRNLPDGDEFILRYAGAERGEGTRRIPDKAMAESLIRDGVIGSLVPLKSAADLAGLEVPVTQSLIVLASTILGADIAAAGRRIEKIGIDVSNVEQARKNIETLAVGVK